MSHAIDFTTGNAGIAYRNERPWHGFGQELTPDADLETWRREAGLDWRAVSAPVMFEHPRDNEHHSGIFGRVSSPVPGRVVLYRSDTKDPLSVVSERYKVFQPGEALEFFREFLRAGGLEMETAGSLDGGRRIWALARVGEDLTLYGQDRVEGFLLLATSFDGSMATTAKFTTVRVVCQNTLHMADSDGAQPTIKVPHSTTFDSSEIAAQLGLRERAWAEFGDVANALADRVVSPSEARDYLLRVFGVPGVPLEKQPESESKQMARAWESIISSPGSTLRAAEGTAWGLLNGVTHMVDYQRRYRNPNNRLGSAWFGTGASDKNHALVEALRLVA